MKTKCNGYIARKNKALSKTQNECGKMCDYFYFVTDTRL